MSDPALAMSNAEALADRTTRLIWSVLVDAGRSDLADTVVDRLAQTCGADLRSRAIAALRLVFAGVVAEHETEDLLHRGVARDELSLLADSDRRLLEDVSTTVDVAGRRRARRVVADLLDRVDQVLSSTHSAMP